jgi:tetratricopeptide (TPR) repeat protein
MADAYATYRSMIAQGRFFEAVREAENAYLHGRPDDPFWLTRQSAALLKAGEHEQALAVARQALALTPSDPFCLLAVADALAGGQHWQEACPYYEEAARAPRTRRYARSRMLQCLLELKSFDHMALLLAGWDLPEVERLAWQVKLLSLQDRREEALAACRHWLELAPDEPAAVWALTELEILKEGLEAVRERMGRLARIPSRPPIYKEIYASLCRRSGRTDIALAQYERMSRTGADPRIQRKEAFVLAKSGRESRAVPIMEELLRKSPADFYVHSAYQAACRRSGQLARALDFYRDLIALYPAQKALHGRMKRIKKELRAAQ